MHARNKEERGKRGGRRVRARRKEVKDEGVEGYMHRAKWKEKTIEKKCEKSGRRNGKYENKCNNERGNPTRQK